jgi:hypothetical protein
VKKVIKNIAQMMHQADPTACFAIEFWDGDAIRFGNFPEVILRLKTKNCTKNIITKGFLGFGEAYMEGDLEIEKDLPMPVCLAKISTGYFFSAKQFHPETSPKKHFLSLRQGQ